MKRQKKHTAKAPTATSRLSPRTLEYAEAPRLSPPLYILIRQEFHTERFRNVYEKAMREGLDNEFFQEYNAIQAAEYDKKKPCKWTGGYYMNFEAVVDEAVKKENLKTEVEKEAARTRIKRKIILERTEHLKGEMGYFIENPWRRGPGRPREVGQKKYEDAADYHDKTRCSWQTLARRFEPDEYAKNPKKCTDKVRMRVERVKLAQRLQATKQNPTPA